MSKAQQLITEHIDTWTSAILAKSGVGRGSSKKRELYGIKKLRELILELAVRGKLVPQDSNDEPASVLLGLVAAEKAELIKAKKIKKPKTLPPIRDDEKPFELPHGWECCRLGALVAKLGSGSTPRGGKSAYVSSGIPFLRSQNVWNEGLNFDDIAYINNETHQRMENTVVYPGDILLNITGASLGRSAVFPDTYPEANVSQHVTIIRLIDSDITPFMHLCIRSPLIQSIVWGRQVGMAIEGLSKKVLELFEMPIPPLDEQNRIVAKVDELILLCDQLERQTEDSLDAHTTLVEVLLSTLTDSADAHELAQNWNRVAEHFDTLFTTEQSIEALKQTILQLAVMGKLVPQNPEDEPASVLLDKIATEKAILVKEKKIKKQKPLPSISDDEKPFELPQGWEWSRVGEFSYVFAGNSFKSGDFNTKSGTKVVKITNAGVGEFLETEDYLPPDFSDLFESYLVNQGDLILALTRPYISAGLKVSICPASYHKSLLNQRVAAIRHISETDYLYLFLRSPVVLNHYQARFGGSGLQPNLKMSDVLELFIAVPPLSEQHRIVAKVDELMAICDQLKDKLQKSQQTQVHLTDALIDQAII